ncbi:MAG: hypothetical protein AAF790_10190, partial [Planctomycetota bacterium]
MSRPRQNPSAAPVSLFPFLAVLLCTMGALVMLLVAMTHVSRENALLATAEPTPPAAEPAPAEPAQQIDPAAIQQRLVDLEQAEAYLAEVEAEREKVDRVLREDQLRLSQTEDHIRRMQDQLKSMRAAIAELRETESQHYDDRAQAERNLGQLEELIAEAKAEIEELEADRDGAFKSYAIVPYRGANGTERQPIYIECRGDRAILQPEGVELPLSDFDEPLGVGNALAAALRATREYYASKNPDAGHDPDAEPYPLIIVRPDGILMYYRVRRAIRTWDSDFGYELVQDGWGLEYPAANPVLSDLQTRAIDRARMRRALLARAAPSAYGRGGAVGGSPRGRGSGATQPYDRDVLSSRPTGPAPPSIDPGGTGIAGRGSRPLGRPEFGGPGMAGGGPGIAAAGVPGSETPSQTPTPDRLAARGGASGDDQPSGETQPNASAKPPQSGGDQSSPPPSGRATQAVASAGQPGRGSDRPAGAAAAGASGSVSMTASPAQSRGADWAVEKGSPRDIAIQRSVQVLVRQDRLVVLPGRDRPVGRGVSSNVGSTVYLDGATAGGLDDFVTRVQQAVRSWGIAGRGLYWRPVLMLNV